MLSDIKKITILAHERHKKEIIDLLFKKGVLQIEHAKSLSSPSAHSMRTGTCEFDVESNLTQVSQAIEFLTKEENTDKAKAEFSRFPLIDSHKKKPKRMNLPLINNLKAKLETLKKQMMEKQIKVTLKEMEELQQNFKSRPIIENCQSLKEKLSHARAEREKLEEEKNKIFPWQHLNIAPAKSQTKNSETIIGLVPAKRWTQAKSTFDETPLVQYRKLELPEQDVESRTPYINIILTYHKKIEDKIKKTLTKFEFKRASFIENLTLLPKEKLSKINEELELLEEEIRSTKEEIKVNLGFLKNLKILYDWLCRQKEKQEAEKKILTTDYTFALAGFIDKDSIPELKEDLKKITSGQELIVREPEKKEKVPVLIKNSRAVRPFESVTNIYGMPLASEPDPTPLLAPFFIIFFGFCIGDAGYGIVLIGLAWALIKILKLPTEAQRLPRLLIYGGLTTFAWGVIFGGWFGISAETLGSSWVGRTLLKGQIFDPVRNPLTILLLSLALGIIQILVGIGINLWWKIKNKKVLDGILDDGLWLFFILSILFWAAASKNIIEPPKWLTTYPVLIGAGALVLTQGRKAKNIILKFFKGLLSLYRLIGYLSDVLSYSRLLALGLATAIIAMVINMIAGLFKDMIPYLGVVLAVFILIGGHLFNLAINALGAFIHSGRLQFVEFFSKFMEGGGKRFKPFGIKREGKYTLLE